MQNNFATPLSHRHPTQTQTQAHKLSKVFLGGLPKDAIEEELTAALIESFDIDVKELFLKKRKNRGKTKCLGHGILTLPASQVPRLVQVGYLKYKGRKVKMDHCLSGKELKERQKSLKERRIYLSNVLSSTEPSDLQQIMERFGNVESCYFRGQPGTELLVGVTIFATSVQAQNAKNHFSENMKELSKLGGGDMKVGFSFRELKDQNCVTLEKKVIKEECVVHRTKPTWKNYNHKDEKRIENLMKEGNLVLNKGRRSCRSLLYHQRQTGSNQYVFRGGFWR